MNYLRKLRSRKGFTLVELIVVIALIAIIVVCVAAFSTPVTSLVKGSKARSDAVTINKIIGDYIENRISYAESLRIYLNCNANNGTTDQYNDGSFSAGMSKLAPSDTRGNGGALVIRFVRDGDIDARDTYKLYDIPYNAAWPGTNETEWAKHAVFDDSFYNQYQFFINLDKYTVDAVHNADPNKSPYPYNKAKGKFFLNLDITSFDFTAENIDEGLKLYYMGEDGNTGVLRSDTEYKTGVSTVNPLDELELRRTGAESISMLLHNVKVDTSIPGKPTPNFTFGTKGSNLVIKGLKGADFNGGNPFGSDIVILYRTEYYDYADVDTTP